MFVVLFILFFAVSVLLAYIAYRFAKMLFSIEDRAQKGIQELEESLEELNQILEIPIYSDSNEVRRVVDIIKKSRVSVIFAISSLTGEEIKANEQKSTAIEDLQKSLLSFNSSPIKNKQGGTE